MVCQWLVASCGLVKKRSNGAAVVPVEVGVYTPMLPMGVDVDPQNDVPGKVEQKVGDRDGVFACVLLQDVEREVTTGKLLFKL